MITPNVADFRECVVRQWTDAMTHTPYWTVEVHQNLAYVFSPPSIKPGWLSTLRFSSYDEAVAFVDELRPHILRAKQGHSMMCAGARAATDLIYATSGRQRTEVSP